MHKLPLKILLGYIEEAKAKRYLPNAKACMDAARAIFVEQYAKNGDVPAGTPVILGATARSTSGNEDQDFSGTVLADHLFSLAGMNGSQKPYR
ncbi:MAG: hypothetical protein K6B69_12235 [Lachnospiraceae bacterium]|nr:hypothetical protein [Lachnospiraceae bacterium]